MIMDPHFLFGWAIVTIPRVQNAMMRLGIFWMFHWPLFWLSDHESVLSSHMAVRTSKVTRSVHAALLF